jgi:hypothetical protein
LKVFENSVLRKIFGLNRNWRRMPNEKRHNFYPVANIRVIKSRRMRGVRHVARMGEREGTCKNETTYKTYAYMGGKY